ncbi:hypothetical protein C8J56DRAFT_806601, partial [Mycena floridula]
MGKYNVKLASQSDIKGWLATEEQEHTIELIYKETRPNRCKKYAHAWTSKVIYVCSRQGSGGKKNYIAKNPGRHRKINKKHSGCSCRITFKKYPDTDVVLGFYTKQHDHATGKANAPYIRVSNDDRVRIAGMLRMGISPQRVVRASFILFTLEEMQRGIHKESNLDHLRDDNRKSTRSEFITMADIRRIQKGIEAEDIRMHTKDSLSTLEWVNRCREEGSLLAFKASSDLPPEGSTMDPEDKTFFLGIQTRYQQECWEELGGSFAGLDATHNTT